MAEEEKHTMGIDWKGRRLKPLKTKTVEVTELQATPGCKYLIGIDMDEDAPHGSTVHSHERKLLDGLLGAGNYIFCNQERMPTVVEIKPKRTFNEVMRHIKVMAPKTTAFNFEPGSHVHSLVSLVVEALLDE